MLIWTSMHSAGFLTSRPPASDSKKRVGNSRLMTRGNDLTHRVFLIRHGETVDNVAGLYAGIRDSSLTNHGVTQAQKLGKYFVDNGVSFTHIYSSDISRALKTGGHIKSAQTDAVQKRLDIEQCVELREQDFGFFEGRSWTDDMAAMRAKHAKDSDFRDVETKQSLSLRAARFLEVYLMPALNQAQADGIALTVAVVSHGMLLSSLWKAVLAQQPPDSIRFLPDATNGRDESLRLPRWSNTGYMELVLNSASNGPSGIAKPEVTSTKNDLTSGPVSTSDDEVCLHDEHSAPFKSLRGSAESAKGLHDGTFIISIKAINSRAHLQGLKRIRGGIGSSKHDEKQKSISSFFSKRSKQS